jgi:hypothetical protein
MRISCAIDATRSLAARAAAGCDVGRAGGAWVRAGGAGGHTTAGRAGPRCRSGSSGKASAVDPGAGRLGLVDRRGQQAVRLVAELGSQRVGVCVGRVWSQRRRESYPELGARLAQLFDGRGRLALWFGLGLGGQQPLAFSVGGRTRRVRRPGDLRPTLPPSVLAEGREFVVLGRRGVGESHHPEGETEAH